MKVSVAAFFLLIIILTTTAAFHSQPKIPEAVNQPTTCCLKYHEKVLPRKLVVGYRKALNCHLPAIIFVTKKNREVCSDPSNDRVQEYIKDPSLPLLPSRSSGVKMITSKKGQSSS
ncbi:PREDICTED: C-C motif chemokine 16 [Propithecus coquereli]|uniref:C-C motif chemokine 16 n=1 Tax=Propithecus coquereli TaxID=379532 RepID=UPI00063F75C8|nr:PREDICTED: C-C motif chemokine 16 [Propithecus coquereli]